MAHSLTTRSCTMVAPAAPRSPWRRIMAWAALSRQRRDLSALDDHLLRDVGLTTHEARREADRPFWDAPENWHH